MSVEGYTTLMKGVAGVPGDMYQIWTSPATMNVNNPQAMYLTNTFKGHYKTDLSQWNSMCLDRVHIYKFISCTHSPCSMLLPVEYKKNCKEKK